MTGDSRLTGDVVELRDWRLDDLAPYREWLRPHHEWHAWDGPYFPRPTDAQADEICAQLRRRITAADWPTPRTSLVIADPDSGALLGCVSWYYESEATGHTVCARSARSSAGPNRRACVTPGSYAGSPTTASCTA